VTVQIFGFRNDPDTRKAQRFFAERGIAVHFVDLAERPASPGELRRFRERFGAAALVNRASPRFRDLGLSATGDSPGRLLERASRQPPCLALVRLATGSAGHAPDAMGRVDGGGAHRRAGEGPKR
jgi:arsenate reductase-like glutaredoxin family protein